MADLDPTDRRFRVYNQAAEVLLDPARRTAYDAAERASYRPARVRSELAREEAAPVARLECPPWRRDGGGVPACADRRPGGRHGDPAGLRRRRPDHSRRTPRSRSTPTPPRPPRSTRSCRSCPTTRTRWTASQAQATAVMTSSEQEQYRRLFAVIRQNAPRTATVVRAQYVSSGVVRTGTDQVDVLVFVNQRTTNRTHPKVPVVYKSQVTHDHGQGRRTVARRRAAHQQRRVLSRDDPPTHPPTDPATDPQTDSPTGAEVLDLRAARVHHRGNIRPSGSGGICGASSSAVRSLFAPALIC